MSTTPFSLTIDATQLFNTEYVALKAKYQVPSVNTSMPSGEFTDSLISLQKINGSTAAHYYQYFESIVDKIENFK